MPTYPFANERYWINEISDFRFQISDLKNQLHPLVHENTSTLEQQQFSSTFTGQEFFFSDHQVLKDKVLPGVAYLEMARAAAKHAGLEHLHVIQNVIWGSPIRVRDQAERVIIALYPESDGVAYEVITGENRVHSQGKVIAGEAPGKPPPQDINTISERCRQSIDPEQLYTTYRKLGISYGLSFRGIKSLHYSNHEVLARIELPSRTGFEFNAATLDSALQASIGLSINKLNDVNNSPYVPFALKEARFFDTLPEVVYSHVTHAPDKTGSGVAKYDITVLDSDSNVLVQLKELATRKMTLTETVIPGQNEIKTDVLYATCQWQDKELCTNGHKVDFKHFELPLTAMSTPKKIISAYMQVFNQIKEIFASKPKESRILLWTVSNSVPEYCFTPIVGLLKTANLENPKILGKVIFLPKLSKEKTQQILEQEAPDMTDVEVRYLSAEHRQVKQLTEVKPGQSQSKNHIKSGGIYLIVGGAGGLGLIFADYISTINDTRVILTGRSAKPKADTQFDYLMCDISKLAEVKQTIKAIHEKYGQLNGIIHSAGLIRDNFILKKAKDEIDAVMAPKVEGAWNLHEALKANNINPDFVVFFFLHCGCYRQPGPGRLFRG